MGVSVRQTWKTVSKAIGKLLKFAGGVPSGKLKAPPNSCIPNRAKMRMNKKSRNRRERIDRMELSNEITKFRSDDQYLKAKVKKKKKSDKMENEKQRKIISSASKL